MTDPPQLGASPDYTQARRFWQLMGYAALLGVVGAVTGLVFISVTGLGSEWYGDQPTGWMDGHLWWVLVAAAAGLLVGLLRVAFKTPDKTPGLIEDLTDQHVDHRTVPSVVAISAVSLIGGASLGPEVALGQVGGGTAGLIGERRDLDDDTTKALTVSGIAGAFGGLFSSPLMSVILCLEVARPSRKVFGNALYGGIVASGISFGIYFAVAGSVFLGIYEVPTYDYRDWHLLAALAFGVLAALVVLATLAVVSVTKKALGALKLPTVAEPVLGGILFGLVGVALPLTNFTGSEQLAVALGDTSNLGTGLLVAVLLAKMFTFAVSSSTGFIGGPIFPILFIGGMSGIIINQLIPEVPLGLAFACMLAAVPGAVVSAPFSLVLLAALLTQVGAIQTAPILIAVATASLTIAGLRYVIAQRKQAATLTGAGQ
jgi:H+/Cl- antiporter ClcA